MPTMPRLVLALFLTAFSALCAAADWPSQTIRFVVPAPAGSSVDGVARLIAERLSKVLGQSIIVDNRGGAGGTIGTDAVVRARRPHLPGRLQRAADGRAVALCQAALPERARSGADHPGGDPAQRAGGARRP